MHPGFAIRKVVRRLLFIVDTRKFFFRNSRHQQPEAVFSLPHAGNHDFLDVCIVEKLKIGIENPRRILRGNRAVKHIVEHDNQLLFSRQILHVLKRARAGNRVFALGKLRHDFARTDRGVRIARFSHFQHGKRLRDLVAGNSHRPQQRNNRRFVIHIEDAVVDQGIDRFGSSLADGDCSVFAIGRFSEHIRRLRHKAAFFAVRAADVMIFDRVIDKRRLTNGADPRIVDQIDAPGDVAFQPVQPEKVLLSARNLRSNPRGNQIIRVQDQLCGNGDSAADNRCDVLGMRVVVDRIAEQPGQQKILRMQQLAHLTGTALIDFKDTDVHF